MTYPEGNGGRIVEASVTRNQYYFDRSTLKWNVRLRRRYGMGLRYNLVSAPTRVNHGHHRQRVWLGSSFCTACPPYYL